MRKRALNSVLITIGLATGLMGQTALPASGTEKAIAEFRQLTRELNETVRSFSGHVDQAIARHDRGYRLEDGRLVPAADADLIGGPSDVTWAAIRKFVSFRLMAAVHAGVPIHDAAAADLERIQNLILEIGKDVDASAPVLRSLLVVSVADLDPHSDLGAKAGHEQLLKARGAAEDAARRAMLVLPLDQPNDTAAEENAEKMWDALGRAMPWRKSAAQGASETADSRKADPNPPAIPVAFERRRRFTLINEGAYRMAITDSGIDDAQGRHLFYQEEWVQRGQSVIRYRWRVGVDAATGEHVMLRRYPARELQGTLAEVYDRRDRDYIWYLEPPDDAAEPTRDAIELALSEVQLAGVAVRNAAKDFKATIRDELAKQDVRHSLANEPVVDSGLPEGIRLSLFTVRAHLARVAGVMAAENAVRGAIKEADAKVRDLEPLAAWSNKFANSPGWAQVLDRSDREIEGVRDAETEALRAIPPDSARGDQQFPAMDKNSIIRMRRPRTKIPNDKNVQCLQEVWRVEVGPYGTREVKRMVSLVLIDPETGSQTRVGGATRYYKLSDGEVLEEVFDEYAADEVGLGS